MKPLAPASKISAPTTNERRRAFTQAMRVARLALAALLATSLFIRSAWNETPRALGDGIGARPAATKSATSSALAQTIEAKIQELSEPSSRGPASFQPIVITEGEANNYLKSHGAEFLPPGVRDPEIHIKPEDVSGAADVDFDELNRASPVKDDWGERLLAYIFKGKQRVTASGRLESSGGQGKLSIVKVVVGTTAIPDWLVSFIIQNYVQSRYKVDLSKPFVLPDHVTHIELAPGQATFLRRADKKP